MASRFTSARWGAAALVAGAGLLLAPEVAAQGRCFGLTAADYEAAGFDVADFSGQTGPVHVVSGGGSVAIIGSPGDDTLNAAAASNAVICGKGGAEFITGGLGPDQLKGGPGNDTIWANGGADLAKGGAGNDQVHGEAP